AARGEARLPSLPPPSTAPLSARATTRLAGRPRGGRWSRSKQAPASAVSATRCPQSPTWWNRITLPRSVAKFFHHLGGLGTLHEREEGLGRLIAFAAAQQHGVLPDRAVEICRHHPSRAALPGDHL